MILKKEKKKTIRNEKVLEKWKKHGEVQCVHSAQETNTNDSRPDPGVRAQGDKNPTMTSLANY